jgi:hypothetical protein
VPRQTAVPYGPAAIAAACRALLHACSALIAAGVLLIAAPAAWAQVENVELTELRARRTDEGVLLDFATRFNLPRPVDEALHKGVPLHFVAEAELYRRRWYWRDARVAQASRTWRVTYQPLTLNYRVSFGALAQSYATLADALSALKRSAGWRIGEPLAPDDDARYYVEFSFRLDTSLLPRPLQIGIGAQPEWNPAVDANIRVPPPDVPPPAAAAAAASEAAR